MELGDIGMKMVKLLGEIPTIWAVEKDNGCIFMKMANLQNHCPINTIC